MDPRTAYLQKHQIPELVDGLVHKLLEASPANAKQFLASLLTAQADTRFPAAQSMPNMALSKTILARVLTQEIFLKLRDKHTIDGSSFDRCIEDALDFAVSGRPPLPGGLQPCGLVASDEDCFVTFSEIFDQVLQARHQVPSYLAPQAPFYVLNDAIVSKVRGGFSFDAQVVHWIVVKVKRNIRGTRFAPQISRAERREVERLLRDQSKRFTGANEGRYYSVLGQPLVLENNRRNTHLLLPRYAARRLPSCYRDWPDARGVFVSNDHSTSFHVNGGTEHLEVVSAASSTHNVRDAFERALEWTKVIGDGLADSGRKYATDPKLGALTAELDYVGSGMSIEAKLKLPFLARHSKLAEVMKKLSVKVLQPGVGEAAPDLVLSEEDLVAKAAAAAAAGGSVSFLEGGGQGNASGGGDGGGSGDRSAQEPGPMSPTGMGPGSPVTMGGDRSLLTIGSAESLSTTPTGVLQLFVDAVLKLIDIEAALSKGSPLDF